MTSIQAVKGTRDILPDDVPAWRRVEEAAHRLFPRYGYREIRTPIFEVTELFARSIGSDTDIVAKEMYSFTDPGGESLTLRPEATAGIVRAVIEHNLMSSDPALKVYALGPMFRRERPQRGRYRQFHQLDVEVFGVSKPAIDVEVMQLATDYTRACGLLQYDLVLNSVGDAKCRPEYLEILRAALRKHASKLCADCQRRAETNPLRVLDCKVPEDQAIIEGLPKIADNLCPECRDHFGDVRQGLDDLEIPYTVNHRLVRGLDYYTRTTFEIVSYDLGAQNSVLGGGRYDGLVKDLGGPDVTGIGFALGMERLVSLVPNLAAERRCDVFLIPLAAGSQRRAMLLQRDLRAAKDRDIRVLMDYEGHGLKSQMKRANKLGARFVAIMGEDEMADGTWTIRDMASSTQERISEARVLDHLKERLSNG